MKYDVQFTNQFKKDLKLAEKQNKNLNKLFEVIEILANGETLDARYKDNGFTGNYKGTRECHIEPDWCRYDVICFHGISCLRSPFFSTGDLAPASIPAFQPFFLHPLSPAFSQFGPCSRVFPREPRRFCPKA